jgi:hypothetical protein
MIDVLKVFVDALKRVVPLVAGDRARPARLGFDLLIAYATLNRSLMVAEDVVGKAELVAGQARDESWLSGKGPGGVLSDLEYLLKTQLRNLNKVETMLVDRYRDQLGQAGDEFAELRARVGAGSSVLRVLLTRLGRNQLPLEGLPLLGTETIRPATPEVLDLNKNREAIAAGLTAYLALWQPRERVAQVRDSLTDLRTSLLSGFEFDDILPLVGDTRFR